MESCRNRETDHNDLVGDPAVSALLRHFITINQSMVTSESIPHDGERVTVSCMDFQEASRISN
jgi:hypothetical protein